MGSVSNHTHLSISLLSVPFATRCLSLQLSINLLSIISLSCLSLYLCFCPTLLTKLLVFYLSLSVTYPSQAVFPSCQSLYDAFVPCLSLYPSFNSSNSFSCMLSSHSIVLSSVCVSLCTFYLSLSTQSVSLLCLSVSLVSHCLLFLHSLSFVPSCLFSALSICLLSNSFLPIVILLSWSLIHPIHSQLSVSLSLSLLSNSFVCPSLYMSFCPQLSVSAVYLSFS